MNWTCKSLKKQGYSALQDNYWKTCFMTILLMTLSVGTVFSAIMDFMTEVPSAISDLYESLSQPGQNIDLQVVAVMITLTFGVLLLNTIAKIVLDIFVKNPVQIGICRFMKRNLEPDDKGMIADLGYGFDHEFKNNVKIMFLTRLVEIAAFCILIVPGIIKMYEFYLVPYLVSDRLDMTPREAMKLSKKMMYGNKRKVLLLDLSFIPLHLLGILSMGILEVFYVVPYQHATKAALYKTIREQYIMNAE